ncbi:MMPL family transporter [Actinoplanes sp. KI2]|uniref:MMPL family transporter n=1 Tax=Actinoplanes sp. KI2 TaxID=2983315 RepID=UPI0021D58FEB|nr:MMPL family transporter [Actinoplanes sp. KI2]MCU7725008.1 MMPL family transporter [Actinoplanes sp. KI2]
MATLLHRLGLAAVRHRIVVTVAWLVALVAVGVGAATLSGPTVNSFSIPGQESTIALDLLKQRFGNASAGATAQVVFEAPGGGKITDPANAGQVAQAVAAFGKLPGVVAATNPLDPKSPIVSRDQTAAYSTLSYGVQASEITADERDALTDAVAQARTGGLTVEVRGDATKESGADVGGPAEGIGVVVALLVLALTYRSLVAAGMNLLTAIVGVAIGALGIVTLTGFVDLQSTTSILAVMLGLAVGIDYALFIFTRFRQELWRGLPVPEAAAMAVGTAGSAVVTAGLTVVIALAGLSVAGIPFLTEMGLAAAATIVIAVLVAITLVPAVLGLIGLKALPRKRRTVPEPPRPERGFFKGWANLVTRRHWLSLVVAVAALGVIAIPVTRMQTSLILKQVPGSTQAKADAIIAERFGPGFAGPLLVLVDGPGSGSWASSVSRQVATLPGVAVATPPRPNQAGDAALITIIPASGPDSPATVDLVHAVRDKVNDGPGAKVYVTGQTAISIDVSQKLDAALPVYLALVVGLAFLLLVLVFRSILVPVVGVLGFLLTIGAAFGATVAVFQWGWLSDLANVQVNGPLLSLSPIIIVGILFGLAMDYMVFMVSRMHEAHAHGAAPRVAVVTGFRQAAPVVVAAATIMFSVFAGFVPQGNDTVKPIAFALAIGILFDALVVRMIAIPAAISIMGKAAWWLPRWLRKLPALDVEGAALEREPKEPVPVG